MALALGYTVTELQERIDAKEFTKWVAYYKIEPFGQERADFNAAVISSTIAASVGAKGKALKIETYMPDFKKEQRQQTSEEMINIAKAFTRRHNNGS